MDSLPSSARRVLLYSTFLGGSVFYSYTSYAAIPGGIAVDTIGNAYIAGYTTTPDFPTYGTAYQPTPFPNGATGVMGFVTKLNAASTVSAGVGTASAYSTYLYAPIQAYISGLSEGGNDTNNVGGFTYLNAIVVDASGNAYVTGGFGPDFPTTPGAYQSTPDLTSSLSPPYTDYGGDICLSQQWK